MFFCFLVRICENIAGACLCEEFLGAFGNSLGMGRGRELQDFACISGSLDVVANIISVNPYAHLAA